MPRVAISIADAQASGASKARLPIVEEYPGQTSSAAIRQGRRDAAASAPTPFLPSDSTRRILRHVELHQGMFQQPGIFDKAEGARIAWL
jgi:hypothetical protein